LVGAEGFEPPASCMQGGSGRVKIDISAGQRAMARWWHAGDLR
jgi:hypothetical protein